MTSRSLALLVLLVSALAACQAYDRGRYNGLLDASDRADVADSIDAPADASMPVATERTATRSRPTATMR